MTATGTAARLLGPRDVAARLNVSRSTAYRLMRKMPHVVLGHRLLRVTDVSLSEYLEQREVEPCPTDCGGSVAWMVSRRDRGTGRISTRRASGDRSAPGSSTGRPLGESSEKSSGRPQLREVQPRTRR